jgi:hypothetical protein
MKYIRKGNYCIFNERALEFSQDYDVCTIIYKGELNEFIRTNNFARYAENIYILNVNCNSIKSAFYVETLCLYKGLKFYVDAILEDDKYRIFPLDEAQVKLGNVAKHAYDPVFEISKKEIEKIWEERKPINGYKFDVEPVFVLDK